VKEPQTRDEDAPCPARVLQSPKELLGLFSGLTVQSPGKDRPTYVLGRKGGTDWEDGAASSCCLGEAPFAALRVVRVYDMLLYAAV